MNKNYAMLIFFALCINAHVIFAMRKIEQSASPVEKTDFIEEVEQDEASDSAFDLNSLIEKIEKRNKKYREDIEREDKNFKKLSDKLAKSYSDLCDTSVVDLECYKDLKEQDSYLEYRKNISNYNEKKEYFKGLKNENDDLKIILEGIKQKILSLENNLENNEQVLATKCSVFFTEKIRDVARYTMFTFLVAITTTACCL